MQGLAGLLQSDFELVGTVGDGRALLDAARRLRPDVIVTDLAMPVLDGLDALRRLRRQGSACKVIFLTMHADGHLAAEALRAGASGYVLKHAASEELVRAIHEVFQGRVYLTPLLARDIVTALAEQAGDTGLTPRQRDVLRLIAEGGTMKKIAVALGLSRRTVEAHKYEIMKALGLHSTAELVRYALDHGIVVREPGFPSPCPPGR